MEILVLLLILVVGYLWFSLAGLKKKVAQLELLSRADEQGSAPTVAPKEDAATAEKDAAQAKSVGPWDKIASITSQDAAPEPDRPEPAKSPPPRAFVFRQENIANSGRWLAQNWFLAIAALSLALAGVFLVQYGVENGLLSPFWRVMGAAFFGAALIWGGEFIRRRSGDEGKSHSVFIPSTFSGAGLVALFAAVLAARQLYGLIGSEAALVYLVMVSAVAVVLGWYYGPFLAVAGILGSLSAPFLVGGESTSPGLFFYYFALIIMAALAVDAIRRWAWVSASALIAGFGSSWYFWTLGAGGEHFLAFGLITTVAAMALPGLSIWPTHTGDLVGIGLLRRLRLISADLGEPAAINFPTRLAASTVAAAAAIAALVAVDASTTAEVWLAIAALCVLFLLLTIWARNAAALADLAIIPPAVLLGVVAVQSIDWGVLIQEFEAGLARPLETAPPVTVSVLAAIGLVGSAIAHWRGLWPGRLRHGWSGGAAVLAPLMLVTLEFFWEPRAVLGPGYWAAHGMAVAAVMVLFAGQVARRDDADKRRVAYFTLAALVMISFALIIVLSSAALTVALAVMVLGAAVIDRRFDLGLLSLFVQIGTIVVGWRLVFSPGLFWATDAPIPEITLAYAGSGILLAAALLVLGARNRNNARMTVESGIWAILGIFVSVLLYRALGGEVESHWAISLFASVWLILMLVQLYRMPSGGGRMLRWVRVGLSILYGLFATAGFVALGLLFNPLAPLAVNGDPVIGPLLLDSLSVAFVIPALILAVGVWKIANLHHWLRGIFISLSAIFAIIYVGFEVRRWWHGRDLSAPSVTQGELYSYTIAMLLGSVGLLFLAFSRRSVTLRRIATLGIAATIAKVFLIDMAGLTGLMRVASFLGLGLSLAGLGWLYRRMAAQWERSDIGN